MDSKGDVKADDAGPGAENSPLFLPDPYDDGDGDDNGDDEGSDSDKENIPPAYYVPLLTYADRHQIGEWLCRLARYHDQTADALREGIDLIFALKAISDPPTSKDVCSNNASSTARDRRSQTPGEDKGKGKGRAPRQSPTPAPIDGDMLSPLWEPRTLESPPQVSALFGKMGGIACDSGFRTEAGPSRVNARPAPVVEKTPNIADLYVSEQKRKASRKAAEAARATRNKRLRSK